MRFFSTAALLLLAAAVNLLASAAAAAEPLVIADGTGGLNLNALAFAAAISNRGDEEIIIRKMSAAEALVALRKKEAALAIMVRQDIPAAFAREATIYPYARAALFFYLSPTHKITSVTLAQLRQWWSAPRPVWQSNGFDIQRVASQETWLEKRFFRPAPEIYRPAIAGSHIANTATLFCANSPEYMSSRQQLLAIDGIMPTTANIQSGKYPLTADFVVVSPGRPDERKTRLFKALRHQKVYQLLHEAGLFPPPLQGKSQ